MDKCECSKSIEIGQSAGKPWIEEPSETSLQRRTAMLNKYNGKRWGSIYKLADSRGRVRYIGQTIRPLRERLTGHVSRSKQINNYVHRWIRKENYCFGIQLIKTYPINLLTTAESYWMNYYLKTGSKLTNHRIPVQPGMLNFKHTEEAKKKISIGGKNRAPASLETRKRIAEANFIPVIATKDGIDYHFKSIQDACKFTGAHDSNVSRAIKRIGRYKAAGYTWRYSPAFSEN